MKKISLNLNTYKIIEYFKQEKETNNIINNKIQKVEIHCTIDLNIFKELLHKYNLLNNFDNLLYAGLRMKRINELRILSAKFSGIENEKNEKQKCLNMKMFNENKNLFGDTYLIKEEENYNKERIKETYEQFLVLKCLFTTDKEANNISNTQIKLINLKDKKGSVIINNGNTIYKFYEWNKKELISKFKKIKGFKPALLNQEYFINYFIKELKNSNKKGRKNERKYLQDKVYNTWNFLQNETHINAKAENIISNEQCRFIYDFFILFELIEEQNTGSLAEEYIRTLLVNRTKLKSNKSAK